MEALLKQFQDLIKSTSSDFSSLGGQALNIAEKKSAIIKDEAQKKMIDQAISDVKNGSTDANSIMDKFKPFLDGSNL